MTAEHKNLEVLIEIIRRGLVVEGDRETPWGEKQRLLREIVRLGRQANGGRIPREDWETHELNWIAYISNLRSNLIWAVTMAIIDFERDMRSSDQLVELSDETKKIYMWWYLEGGREQLLGELPLEQRRALELSEQN